MTMHRIALALVAGLSLVAPASADYVIRDGGNVNRTIDAFRTNSNTKELPKHAPTDASGATLAGSSTGGTAAASSLLIGGIYRSSLPTLTTGQQTGVTFDVNGRLLAVTRLQDGSGNALTSTAAGAQRALDVVIRDSAGTIIDSFGGGTGGAGDASAANQTSQITQETAINTILGLQADTVCATDNGTCTVSALLKRSNARLSTLIGLYPTALGANGGLKIEGVASGTPVPVSGTFWQATQPVSVASVPSHDVTNAGTFAVQASVSGALPAGTSIIGQVGIDQTTPGTTNLVALTAETTKVIGTVRSGGAVADAAATSGNPVPVGGVYESAPPTYTAGQRTTVHTGTRGALWTQLMNSDNTTAVPTVTIAGTGMTLAGATYKFVGLTGLYNGSTVDLAVNGNGTNTLAQRVTIASDTTGVVASKSEGATGAAPPAQAAYMGANTSGATGGLMAGMIQCDSSAVYDASTSGSTELKALTSGRSVYVCGYSIMAAGTVNVKLITGTGTACATGAANITPAFQLTAQAGIVDGSPFYRGLKGASANALCINTSAAVAVQAIIYYAVL